MIPKIATSVIIYNIELLLSVIGPLLPFQNCDCHVALAATIGS